jgi:hypothetical protein
MASRAVRAAARVGALAPAVLGSALRARGASAAATTTAFASAVSARSFAAAAAAPAAGDFISLDESKQSLEDIISKNVNVITYFTAS